MVQLGSPSAAEYKDDVKPELEYLACRISAEEALRLGLVSRVIEPEELLPQAVELANKIGSFSQPAVAKAKECVNLAEQVSLRSGLAYERFVLISCCSFASSSCAWACIVDMQGLQMVQLSPRCAASTLWHLNCQLVQGQHSFVQQEGSQTIECSLVTAFQ